MGIQLNLPIHYILSTYYVPAIMVGTGVPIASQLDSAFVWCLAQCLVYRKLQSIVSIILLIMVVILISELCYKCTEKFNYILNPLVSIKINKSFNLLRNHRGIPNPQEHPATHSKKP